MARLAESARIIFKPPSRVACRRLPRDLVLASMAITPGGNLGIFLAQSLQGF